MSPRSKSLVIGLSMLLGLLPPAVSEAGSTGKSNRIIRFYQDHISGADGNRCPMSPSCSEYAAQALEKHGPIKGWIMVFDRVMRCGRSEIKLAPKIWFNGEKKTHDPVSANDFWWFEALPDKGEK